MIFKKCSVCGKAYGVGPYDLESDNTKCTKCNVDELEVLYYNKNKEVY